MVRPLKYRFKGGALYYAVVVILVLSLLSAGFILLNRLWFHENTLFFKNTALNDNLDSAAEWLKVQPAIVKPGETKELDIFGDSTMVSVEAKTWGLLRLIKSSARWNNLIINRTALYAGISNQQKALYLADKNKFLSLVGKCVITGDCSLPALGIRAGELDGGTFIGKTMIDGKIFQSENTLPEISQDLLHPWLGYWDKVFSANDRVVSFTDMRRHPDYFTSFNSPTTVIDCGNSACLQDISLSGNILVVARDTITILPSAHLKDILVFAKTIMVEKSVKGNFQLFARGYVSIDENCILQYPSFVVCFAKQQPVAKVSIGKNSVVNGGILIDSETQSLLSNRLEMAEGTMLTGTVYVNGEVGFVGQIDGSLYCNQFFIDTPRAYYENFLKDAVINSQSARAKYGTYVINGAPEQLKFVKLCL